MTQRTALDRRMNIRAIVWPIFIEQMLRMSMMAVDTLMLSQYSDNAVAAVGLTGQMIFFMVIMYTVASTGTAVLIGQYLGSGRKAQAEHYAHAGFSVSLLMGVLIGLLFFFGSESVVSWYQLEPAVERYAIEYLIIVGTCSIGMSASVLLSSVLRAHGHSRAPMLIQLLSGVLNVIGNYVALFGPFGLPVTGVAGVAVATVLSQVVAMLVSLLVIRYFGLNFSLRACLRVDRSRFGDIFRLGVPGAAEGLSYNLAQIAILSFVAQLGTAALAAIAIAFTISRFIFVFSLSLGSGAQIISSYFIGQNRIQGLKASVHRYWVSGVVVSLTVSIILVIFRHPLAAVFTDDPQIQLLIASLMIVAVFFEPGRAVNLIVISALKGTGDVAFPVKVGVLSMWGVGVVMAWVLGIHWAWGVVGIWLGVALDEWLRAGIMIRRWHREDWVSKAVV